jgi:hypothetical protein
MTFSNYALSALNKLMFGQTAFTPPATIYVGLSGTPPNADGTNVTEPPASAGYGRVAVSNDTSHFHSAPIQPATGQRQSNTLAITFPQATLDWGAVSYVVLYDAPTGGNFLGFGQLGGAQNVVGGDTFVFTADSLTETLQ